MPLFLKFSNTLKMFDIAAVPYHAPIQEGGLYNTIVIGFPLTLLKKRANMLQESAAFGALKKTSDKSP